MTAAVAPCASDDVTNASCDDDDHRRALKWSLRNLSLPKNLTEHLSVHFKAVTF